MVYLIHLDRPIGRSRHYLGWANDAELRFEEHLSGKGSRLTVAACNKGIAMTLCRVWPEGTRSLERQLKNKGRIWQHCPICNPPD